MTDKWKQLSFDFGAWLESNNPSVEHDNNAYIAQRITEENKDYFPPFDPETYSSKEERETWEEISDVLDSHLQLSRTPISETKQVLVSDLTTPFSLYTTLYNYNQNRIDFFPTMTKKILETCFFESKDIYLLNKFFLTYLEKMFFYVSSHASQKEFSEEELRKVSNEIITKSFFHFPNMLSKTLKARRNLFREKFRSKILWNKENKKLYNPRTKKYQF